MRVLIVADCVYCVLLLGVVICFDLGAFYLCNSVASYYFRYLVVLILELLVYLGLDTVCLWLLACLLLCLLRLGLLADIAFVCVSFTCLRCGLVCCVDLMFVELCGC